MLNVKALDSYFIPTVCFMSAINALLPSALHSLQQQTFVAALSSGLGHSFVIWLCFALALKTFITAPIAPQPLHLSQWLCLAGLSLLLLIPSAILSWLICIALCLIWHSGVKQHRHAVLAPLMLIAIASRDPICQSLLNLFTVEILSMDALISGMILHIIETPALITANTLTQSNGHSLLILTGCSAFTNLSLALLLWFCLSLYRHQRLSTQDLIRAALLVLVVLSLNSTRLALMAIDKHGYELLHGPHAQQCIEVATILIALAFIRRRSSHEESIYQDPSYQNLIHKKPSDDQHTDTQRGDRPAEPHLKNQP